MTRILPLLRYDWTLQKRTISLAFIIIAALYICMLLMFFLIKGTIDLDASALEGLPLASAMFCSSFFSYAQIAMVIVVTQILHEKFTAPRTSLSYLTLPGTNAEKWLVMLLDYAIVALGLWIMQLVMNEVTVIIGYFMAPDLSWSFNPFAWTMFQDAFLENMKSEFATSSQGDELALSIFNTTIDKIAKPAMYMAVFANLVQLAIYIVVNMCFCTHGQLKTIACLMGFGAVMGICMIFGMGHAIVTKIAEDSNANPTFLIEWLGGDGFSLFNCIKWYYYLSPILAAAVLYLFYKQIGWKQAK